MQHLTETRKTQSPLTLRSSGTIVKLKVKERIVGWMEVAHVILVSAQVKTTLEFTQGKWALVLTIQNIMTMNE